MNRKELVDAIAAKSGLRKKDAESFLNGFIGAVTAELKKGGSVNLVGFGSFKVTTRAAREARNPRTGEEISIAASRAPVFSAGKGFKDRYND